MKSLLIWISSNLAWTILSFLIGKIYKKLRSTVDVYFFYFVIGLIAGGVSAISIGYLIFLTKRNLNHPFSYTLFVSMIFLFLLAWMLEKLAFWINNEKLNEFAMGIGITGGICMVIFIIVALFKTFYNIF